MTVSVVIPTRNRRAALLRLLERVLPQAGGCGAEVVVVDNGSTDGTVAGVSGHAAAQAGRLRCVVEPVPGATRARNTGGQAARGTVLAFIDDDALPRPGWLDALLVPLADSRVACAGGPVRLDFGAAGPPPWLTAPLAAYLAAYDLGPSPLDLRARPRHEAPRACNMAVRRAAFLAIGGFNLTLGPRSGRPSVGEESELCVRLTTPGHGVHYAPAAEVDHVVDPARLARGWLLRRAFWTGWAEGVIDARHEPARRIAGRLRWHYGARTVGLRRGPWRGASPGGLTAACERREAWGYLLAVLRHRLVPAPSGHRRAPW